MKTLQNQTDNIQAQKQRALQSQGRFKDYITILIIIKQYYYNTGIFPLLRYCTTWFCQKQFGLKNRIPTYAFCITD